jgi:hypothetical protein
MQHRRCVLLAASLALAGAGPASAAASAGAALSGLTVSVTDLDPASAMPPGVVFSADGGGGVVTTYAFDSGSSSLSSESAAADAPLAGDASARSEAGDADAEAAIRGDAFAGTGRAAIAARARRAAPGGFSSAIASAGLGSGGNVDTRFTLAPGTRLDICGTIALRAASDSTGGEYADAGVLLELRGVDGGVVTQDSRFAAGVEAGEGSGVDATTRHFDLVFLGSRNAATTGFFYGNLVAEAGTSGALPMPVPEPAAAACWLAGLAALAAAARRRGSRGPLA